MSSSWIHSNFRVDEQMGDTMTEIHQTGNPILNSKCRRELLSGTNSISLYIHIPFCLRKCRYCDFLSAPRPEAERERYVQALIREVRSQTECPEGTPVDTAFFGGGTPSILSGEQISRIMEALRDKFDILPDAEISLEMNPGTADADKILEFKKAGINRLSMGVQSMHDRELRLLGRIHTVREAKEAFDTARAAGFENINIDLMSALPGQSFESWKDSLRVAVEWKPEHISAYSLIIEPGTPFCDLYEEGKLAPLPDEETDREMYHYTRDFLARHGYARYEISNYALPGRECRHNSGYWTGHPYLGFGIGAASYVNGTRFSNPTDIKTYIESFGQPVRTDIHLLSEEEKMEEFMFLGLRMTSGVNAGLFHERFGRTLEEVYGSLIRRHMAQGLLEETEQGFCLTEKGTDVSNYVMSDYLL